MVEGGKSQQRVLVHPLAQKTQNVHDPPAHPQAGAQLARQGSPLFGELGQRVLQGQPLKVERAPDAFGKAAQRSAPRIEAPLADLEIDHAHLRSLLPDEDLESLQRIGG
ncbi:MAG: hypothetical protein ABSA30_08970 [Candidatus Aminicenantales bacterium]